jgi:hypothetical protein
MVRRLLSSVALVLMLSSAAVGSARADEGELVGDTLQIPAYRMVFVDVERGVYETFFGEIAYITLASPELCSNDLPCLMARTVWGNGWVAFQQKGWAAGVGFAVVGGYFAYRDAGWRGVAVTLAAGGMVGAVGRVGQIMFRNARSLDARAGVVGTAGTGGAAVGVLAQSLLDQYEEEQDSTKPTPPKPR